MTGRQGLRISRRRTFILGLLLLLIITGIAWKITQQRANSPSPDPLPGRLLRERFIPYALPGGDTLYRDDAWLLFLGSRVNEQPLKRVVAFSLSDLQIAWETSLDATPIQALRLGKMFLIVAVTPSASSTKATLYALDERGKILWHGALGSGLVDITRDSGGEIWAAEEEGLAHLTVTSKGLQQDRLPWPAHMSKGEWLRITAFSHEGHSYLVASRGRHVVFYRRRGNTWHVVWEFESAGKVLDLVPLPGTEEALMVLAHSVAYGLDIQGHPTWKVTNSDFNQDGRVFACEDGPVCGAFRNVLGKIYVDVPGKGIRTWALPGGRAHLGIIPLPFPQHLALGLDVGDVDGRRTPEIVVRSLTHIFVYDPEGHLLAMQPIEAGQKAGSAGVVIRLRKEPKYAPVVAHHRIIVSGKSGIHIFTYDGSTTP